VLPEIKKIIRTIRQKEARRIAEKALSLPTADEVKKFLSSVVKQKVPEIPIEP
jgi:phosphoenolpyruvate-protein kinase (PTS system EI component)